MESKISNNIIKANSNVLDYRLPLFPVSRNISSNLSIRNTKWGSVKIEKGILTAHHKDVLDAIMTTSFKRGLDPNNNLNVIFDVVDIRKLLGTKTDWKMIKKVLNDLQNAVISIKGCNSDWSDSHSILEGFSDANTDAYRKLNQYQAKYKKIIFSKSATLRLCEQPSVVINKRVMVDIFKMNHQVSRSLAKWCFSHSNNQNHKLAELLVAVGAINEGDVIDGRNAKRQSYIYRNQLNSDKELLSKVGIHISKQLIVSFRRSNSDSFVITAPKTAVVASNTVGVA